MSVFRIFLGLTFLMLLNACDKKGNVRQIPVSDFFNLTEKTNYRLSPNGKFISYLKHQGKEQSLFIKEIASGMQKKIFVTKYKNIITYCWINNNELIYFEEQLGVRNIAALFIVNRNGGKRKLFGTNANNTLKILDYKLVDSNYLHVLSNQRDSAVMDVYRLNIRNGKMAMELQNQGNFLNWLTDDEGKLRIAISTEGINEALWYRQTDQKPFQKIMTNNFKITFKPLAFAKDKPNTVYAISNVNRDKNALVEVDCLTGKEKNTLFYNDSLNVVEAKYSPEKGKMDYLVYETWKKKKVYLNNDSKDVYQNLEKLLPKAEIHIVAEDGNKNVFVVKTFTDKNPGAYYLYEASTKKISKLSDVNHAIHEEEMCDMNPINFISRDGLKINGYLTLPKGVKKNNLPLVVIPNSGLYLRSSWGYNSDVQFLANRGYAVLQVNYRGSTGYGKFFFTKGFKQRGTGVQNDLDDAVNQLIKNKTVNPHKIAIYGNGFGGQIALNSAIRNPKLYKCAVSNNGILNIFSFLKYVAPFCKLRLAMYYDIIGNPYTDKEYISQISPVFHVNKLKTPVMIMQNTGNPRVNPKDAIQFVRNLKKRKVPVTYFEQTGYGTNERDENKQKIYGKLEQFLYTNLIKNSPNGHKY